MQRFRETLSIALIGLLPLHALLVTVGTKVIAGPGHSPLTYLALWKEGVLALILLIAVIEIVRKKSLVIGNWSLDVLDRLAIGLIALSVVVTAMTHGDWKLYLIGFKYDFIPLVAFVILRCVSWSEDFLPRVFKVLLMVAGGVAVYGIASLFLPQSWFIWLGYSDLHSLYNP
ncbi:MAG: hypothetical protein QF815_02875, partial [Candidatus Peribacteraceae bacterium]|nr:hypothetical protein [Candidatus Peribacteraceae bacterium]